MPTDESAATGERPGGWDVFARARPSWTRSNSSSAGSAPPSWRWSPCCWLIVTALACLVGVGLLLVPAALRALRAVADRERARLSRWGPEIIGPEPVPAGLRAAVADPATRGSWAGCAAHATLGLLLGLVGVTLPISAVQRRHVPAVVAAVATGEAATPSMGLWTVHDWPGALGVGLLGVGWIAIIVGARPGHGPAAGVAGTAAAGARPRTPTCRCGSPQLTATRAAALDAHATELRRIERSLHDGTQNRLVAVTVLLGAARRALARDPAGADGHPRTRPGRRRAGARRAAYGRPRHPAAGAGRPRASPARSPAWPPTARCPAGSTSTCPDGAPPPSRRPPTSWWPRRSPTSPSTAAPRTPPSRSAAAAAGCTCGSRTTAAGGADEARRLRAHRHPPPDRGARRRPHPDQPARWARRP